MNCRMWYQVALYETIVAVALSAPGRPAFGQAADAVTAQQVIAAFRDRQNRVRSARFKWREEHFVAKGAHSIPRSHASPGTEGVVFPDRDITYTMESELSFDGAKMRYSYAGKNPDWKDSKLVFRDYTSAFDGDLCKILQEAEESRPYPKGTITNEKRSEDVTTAAVMPILCAFRFLHREMRPLHCDALRVAGEAKLRDRPCILLEEPPQDPPRYAKSSFWVDREREFSILRWSLSSRQGIALRQVDIDYAKDAKAGWVPVRWKSVRQAEGGQVQASWTAEVTEFTINPVLLASEFQLDFPAGTIVQDMRTGGGYIQPEGGQKRMILASEFPATYEELASTESGMAHASTARRWAFGASILVLFGVAVLLLVRRLRRRVAQ